MFNLITSSASSVVNPCSARNSYPWLALCSTRCTRVAGSRSGTSKDAGGTGDDIMRLLEDLGVSATQDTPDSPPKQAQKAQKGLR